MQYNKAMFKQENRLKREKDVELVFKKGKSVFDSACGVKFKENGQENTRFAIVVGTKVHKSAVQRNKVKRQYREIVKNYLPEFKIGYDVVLLTSEPALELDFADKETRLIKVLRKADLLV